MRKGPLAFFVTKLEEKLEANRKNLISKSTNAIEYYLLGL